MTKTNLNIFIISKYFDNLNKLILFIMKRLKAKYGTKNKRLPPEKVVDYKSLLSTIKTAFPQLPEKFKVSYLDQANEQIFFQDQSDYEAMAYHLQNVVFYIKNQGQSPNVSQIQPTKNNSNSKIGDSMLELLDSNLSQKPIPSQLLTQNVKQPQILQYLNSQLNKNIQSQHKNINPTSSQPQKTIQFESTRREQKFQKLSLSSNNTITKNDSIKEQFSSKQKIQAKKEINVENKEEVKKQDKKTIIQNQTIQVQSKIKSPLKKNDKDKKMSKAECKFCNKEFAGPRWRCTELKCLDIDVCPKCYSQQKHFPKHASHIFLEITDENFWSRINFAVPIKKLLNPCYEKQLDNSSLKVGKFISIQDINSSKPNFVKEMWKKSPLADQIDEGFDAWDAEYEQAQKNK